MSCSDRSLCSTVRIKKKTLEKSANQLSPQRAGQVPNIGCRNSATVAWDADCNYDKLADKDAPRGWFENARA